MCVCVRACVRACTSARVYVCVCAMGVGVCVYVCVYVCMCVRMLCVCVYARVGAVGEGVCPYVLVSTQRCIFFFQPPITGRGRLGENACAICRDTEPVFASRSFVWVTTRRAKTAPVSPWTLQVCMSG